MGQAHRVVSLGLLLTLLVSLLAKPVDAVWWWSKRPKTAHVAASTLAPIEGRSALDDGEKWVEPLLCKVIQL